jgi:hypothetical protein
LSFGWVEGCGDVVWGADYSLRVRGGVLVDFSAFSVRCSGSSSPRSLFVSSSFVIPIDLALSTASDSCNSLQAATTAWFGQLLLWHGDSGATGMRLGGILCGY